MGAEKIRMSDSSAIDERPAEEILAECFKRDLGVEIDPQALRIFIRWRWDRVQTLAHKIHEGA